MSPRRARRRDETPAPLRTPGWAVAEAHPDGEWMVRSVAAEAAAKEYRCPGCQQELRAGIPHIVAWRAGDEAGRRHWHTPCWRARDRRR